jgi:hypothetical protein
VNAAPGSGSDTRAAVPAGLARPIRAEEEQVTGNIMPLRERDTRTVQAPTAVFQASPP